MASGGRRTSDRGRAAAGRDFDALRARRLRAAQMFEQGKRQADVVVALGVSAQTASRWFRAWRAAGREGLAGAGRAGRKRKLSDEQLTKVKDALLKGPRANGFATDVWTLAGVREVIERVTGVRHGPTQTWEILRQRLAWSDPGSAGASR